MAERKRRRGDRFTARTKQRNRALDVIFEADERALLEEEALRGLLAERKVVSTAQVPIGDFGAQIVDAYADNSDDVDTLIEAASEDWALSRMNAVDRSILRAATAEMVHVGTDRAQAIPEWAALARAFSTDRSVGFVMGVLNKVADIRARETGALDDAQDGETNPPFEDVHEAVGSPEGAEAGAKREGVEDFAASLEDDHGINDGSLGDAN
ncbi:MAG: transcription antitermination protein NusB [Actinomycetaceae bacterium]|nr:transcription antitermination protein NusB [Actinomycetaceae bacterium]